MHCHFENYDKILLPGMFMNADISIRQQCYGPATRCYCSTNKEYAFIVKGKNQFQMQELQTGKSENGFIEILSAGSWSGKDFVIKGAYTLLMAMKNVSEE